MNPELLSLLGMPDVPNLLSPSPALSKVQALQQAGQRPMPMPDQVASPRTQQPGGVRGALGRVFGGDYAPGLSPEQNAAAGQQAMIRAGLATLASDNPNALQALAQGALFGQESGADARAQTYAMTQEQRIQQALQDPEIAGMLTPHQRRLIQLLPPMEAVKVLQELLTKSQDPKVVGPEAALVSPTGEELFRNPGAAKDPWAGLPGEVKAALFAAGITDPSQLTPEMRQQVFAQAEQYRRANAMQINLDPSKRTQDLLVGIAADDYRSVAEGANTAAETLARLNEAKNVIARGTTTSRLQDVTLPVRQLAASIGLNFGNIADEELLNAISNDLTLLQTMRLKGAISEKELAFARNSMPNLGNTTRGNVQLIEMLSRLAQRQIDLLNLANDYISEKGVLDHGWLQHKARWIAQQSLFEGLPETPRDPNLPPGRVVR